MLPLCPKCSQTVVKGSRRRVADANSITMVQYYKCEKCNKEYTKRSIELIHRRNFEKEWLASGRTL